MDGHSGWCGLCGDICCHFVILPVIIRNAVHLVLWAFGVLLCFFPLRVWGKFTCCSWLLESQLCLEFISAILTPGPFLKAAVINRPPDLWITPTIKHCWSKCSYRKYPQGNSSSSFPTLLRWAMRSLGKTSFLGCELGWKVPEQTLKDLCLTTPSP